MDEGLFEEGRLLASKRDFEANKLPCIKRNLMQGKAIKSGMSHQCQHDVASLLPIRGHLHC